MLLPFGKSNRKSKSINRKRSKSFSYESLEERQVLASVVGFDAATGALTVDLTDVNDVAQISILNNNIAVNGSDDLSSAGGTQSAAFTDLRSITITGNPALSGQNAMFFGNYLSSNGAAIQSITATGVDNVTFFGQYQTNALAANLSQAGGQVSDAANGQIVVTGPTNITANNNSIVLDNANNDFRGNVTVRAGGLDRDAVFTDVNDIQFSTVDVSGDLRVVAGGDITDSAGATVTIDRDAHFTADSVTLGDNATDALNIGRINSTTTGDLTFVEDSSVVLLDITADNLNVSTIGGIFDGRFTSINVAQTATFEGDRIRIGENGGDTFNAGAVNFNSDGHVHIWEDSSTNFVGSNTALSFNIFSEGDVTDATTAIIDVSAIAGFEGDNVVLGDSGLDSFNAGSIYFRTPGDFSLIEDSATHIIETNNAARRLFLNSADAITDAVDAQISIERIAQFTADTVNIGDSGADSFNAGSIQFATAGQFRIIENSSTNIVGNNSADNTLVTSTGDITNVFENPDTGIGTTLNVTEVGSFTGTNIDLGNQTNDTINLGALSFNSTGTTSVSEDAATHLAVDSQASQLNLVSTGAVTDSLTGSINVSGLANIQGTSILIGESTDDTFNAASVTLNSTGNVDVTEDSGLNLAGVSSAANLRLVAAGNLTDSLTAETRVAGLLDVTGGLVNIGSEDTDILEMGTLRFTSSTANTFITADSDINLVGSSSAADRLLLTTTGDIRDNATAEVLAQNQAVFQGVDVIIGELATDCFDIINGGTANLFVLASGVDNVNVGGC